MVLSIGLGVALSMITWTLVHTMSGDPIPEKSAQLYFPTVDMWGPTAAKAKVGNEPPHLLSYGVATALLRDHRAKYQSAAYWFTPTVIPLAQATHPLSVSGFAVTGEFFPMLNVPFKYGTGWSNEDDAAGAQVAVISESLSEKLFGSGDSVGKTFGINDRNYRVVGVFDRWNPQPTYYDVPAFGGFMLEPTDLFLPFNAAIAAQIPHKGSGQCFDSPAQPGFAGLLQSSCAWVSYVAELPTAADVQSYKNYLEGFAHQSFSWAPNVRLHGLKAWLNYLQVVPPGVRILRIVGIGLLFVCLANTTGLMLAKFMGRTGEIGIRRALGATRRLIFAQFLIEGAVIGVVGGALGLLMTLAGLAWIRLRVPANYSFMTYLDAELLALTIAMAVIAALLAALYPGWRAARVQMAWQLKIG
jgi:putative ABC transport system permease protein